MKADRRLAETSAPAALLRILHFSFFLLPHRANDFALLRNYHHRHLGLSTIVVRDRFGDSLSSSGPAFSEWINKIATP